MFPSENRPQQASSFDFCPEAGLFLWRSPSVVLMGQMEGDRWIVSRGWIRGDTLSHVRRWSFSSAAGLCTQIHRLAFEATASRPEAEAAGAAARTWASMTASS